MQPPAAPCCQDYRGRAHEHERPPLHVINDSADAGAVIVGEEFHDRTAVPSVDPGFEIDSLPQHAHDLKAGEVAEGQHARRGGPARPLAEHRPAERLIVGLVEADPELDQPAHDIRAIEHHFCKELLVGRVVARLERILEVSLWGVFRSHGGLNTAFGHNGIAVAQPKLGRKNHLRAGPCRCERRRTASAAAPHHKNISGGELRSSEIHIIDQRVAL